MSRIDYFMSVLSPFTYLAGTRLDAIAARRGASVVCRPMDVLAVFAATGGVAPKDRHWSRKEYRLQELRRGAAQAGLPINLAPAHWPTDPGPASRALIAAQDAGFAVGPAAHAFLRAVWAEEKNIADPAVVSAVLAQSGVSEAAIAPHLDAAQAAFEQNTRDAIDKGVFGAPFYMVGDERFWGHDRLDQLDAHLAAGAA